jgi:hypothetical protein
MIKKKITYEHNYPISKGELKYKTFINPDKEKYAEIEAKLKENAYFCISVPKGDDTRCPCKEFINLDKENEYCKCGRFFKVLRTPEEIEKYVTAKHFVSSKEKAILKEKIPTENEISIEDE